LFIIRGEEVGNMKTGPWRAWLVAAMAGLVMAMPARAATVEFEDVAPTLFSGSTITSGGFDFASAGTGFSGVDGAGAFVFGNAPVNADGQFLFMLNGDGMAMRASNSKRFYLHGFDASFIAPLGGAGAGILPGELHVAGKKKDGSVVMDVLSFSASDANGDFSFDGFGSGALGGQWLLEVAFAACVFQNDGSCSFDALDVPPQFALDNVNAHVPEPASALLAILALGAAGAAVRRRQR
jgi:hypothetical protein